MNDQTSTEEVYESFTRTGKDAKGRVTGYVVGLREVETGECYAWVQKSVMTSPDTWRDFGARQRSRKFPTLAAAKAWAYPTAKARAAR